jgi:hypothetical protein
MFRPSEAVLIAFVLWVHSGCTPTLDSSDQVHDLRILAMSADPPEVIVDGADGMPSSRIVSPPINVTALVADPLGGGRQVHYRFTTCARVDQSDALVDNSTHRCLAGQLGYRILKEQDFVPGVSAELQYTFMPSSQLLGEAQSLDVYNGFGGLPLPVQLELQAGGESAVGFKSIVYSAPISSPPQAPNTNPRLLGLTVDGQDWSSNANPLFARADHVFIPTPDPTRIESYQRLTFDHQLLQFHETLRYAFFTTLGKFNNPVTGGISNRTGEQVPPDSTWTPPDPPASGTVTFWIVVQDGRGGESWILRSGQIQ